MKIPALTLAFSAVMFSCSLRAQIPGSLDSAFNGGLVTSPVGNFNSFARSIAVQGDGRIIIAGYASNGSDNDYGLMRLLPSGATDLTFGNNGFVLTDFNNTDDFANAIALDETTGKIYVAGYTFNGNGFDFSIACYLTDGNSDAAFGNNGKTITPLGGTAFCKSVKIQPDGKIVVAGYASVASHNQFAVMRYNADGTPDSSFNNTGITFIPFGISNAVVNAMLLQPDGKIVLAGQVFNDLNVRWDFALARLNADGTPDNNFDSDGKLTSIIGNTDNVVTSIALQPDGKIVAAGNSSTSSVDNNLTMARYHTDGSLDPAFGNGGILSAAPNSSGNQVTAVLLQPDGKIITGGFILTGNADRFAVARFMNNGSADNSFGNNGLVITPVGLNDGIYALALQPDGKLLAAGTAFSGSRFDFAIARYETGIVTGLPENTFSEMNIYPCPAKDHAVLTYSLKEIKNVQVDLYDARGIYISTLINSSIRLHGEQTERLYIPASLAAGNYYIVLNTDDEDQVVKMMLVK